MEADTHAANSSEPTPQNGLDALPRVYRGAMGRSHDRDRRRGSRVRPTIWARLRRLLRSGRLISLLLLGLCLVAGIWLLRSPHFTLRHVLVQQNDLLSSSEITALLDLHERSIWQLDLLEAQATLQRHPLIAAAQLKLQLPDTLLVTVTERRPELLWSSGSEQFLLDSAGTLLPLAAGTELQATAVISDLRGLALEAGNQIDRDALHLAQRLHIQLAGQLAIQHFVWSPASGLGIVTSDGRCLLWGTEQHTTRNLQIIAALERQGIAYQFLDLRGRVPLLRTDLPGWLMAPVGPATTS